MMSSLWRDRTRTYSAPASANAFGLRRLARARADAAPAGDRRKDRAHALRRRRALHVDDVHPARDRILGLGRSGHAGEQESHGLIFLAQSYLM